MKLGDIFDCHPHCLHLNTHWLEKRQTLIGMFCLLCRNFLEIPNLMLLQRNSRLWIRMQIPMLSWIRNQGWNCYTLRESLKQIKVKLLSNMVSHLTQNITLETSEFHFTSNCTCLYYSIHLLIQTFIYLWFVFCLVLLTQYLESNHRAPFGQYGSYQHLAVKVLAAVGKLWYRIADVSGVYLMLIFVLFCAKVGL